MSSPAPAMKTLQVTIPDTVPAEIIQNAVGLGLGVMQQAHMGRMVISFPNVSKDDSGQTTITVGQYPVVVKSPDDVMRILKLANTIHQKNKDGQSG